MAPLDALLGQHPWVQAARRRWAAPCSVLPQGPAPDCEWTERLGGGLFPGRQAADRTCAVATSRPRQAGALPGRDWRSTWAASPRPVSGVKPFESVQRPRHPRAAGDQRALSWIGSQGPVKEDTGGRAAGSTEAGLEHVSTWGQCLLQAVVCHLSGGG